MKLLAIVLLGLCTTAAHADPSRARVAALDPPGMTPETVDSWASSPPVSLDEALERDAAADRGAIFDTALTLPRGSVAASARVVSDGGLASASAGLASGLEVTAEVGKLFADRSMTYGATLKLAVIRRSTWQIAVEATYRHVADDCGDCVDESHVLSGGALASGCLDARCRTIATLGAGIVVSDDDNDVAHAITAGLVSGSGSLRVLGEAAWIGGLGFGFLGARLGGNHLALDAGAAASIDATKMRIVPMVGIAGRM